MSILHRVATGLVSEPMHALRTLNQSELVHDLRVADYIIKQYLQLKTKDAVSQVGFTTERELIDYDLIEQADATSDRKRSRNIDTVKRKVPDGYLHIERVDGRKQTLAIEYELTQKAKGKYEEILKRYARMYAQDELNGVVYIVGVPRIQWQIEAVRSSGGTPSQSNFMRPIGCGLNPGRAAWHSGKLVYFWIFRGAFPTKLFLGMNGSPLFIWLKPSKRALRAFLRA